MPNHTVPAAQAPDPAPPSTGPRSTTRLIRFGEHHTWTLVTGDLRGHNRSPVIVLHGGPGGTHDYCRPMSSLAADGRAVVQYDQFGCGKSSHLPDADPTFWSVDLWRDELANLADALGLDQFHLLGHSWGGMLAAEYALLGDERLRSITICSSPASNELWRAAAARLRSELPADVRDALARHEAAGTTDSADYLAAVAEYERRHMCRIEPKPAELLATLDAMEANPTVYHATNGPHEFSANGTFRDWTIVDRLPGISVPTLVLAGEHDEAAPEVWAPYATHIPDARSHVFAGASHQSHIEAAAEFNDVVGSFLRHHDPEAG